MSKKAKPTDPVANRLLYCGGEWRTHRAWLDHFTALTDDRQLVDFYMFHLMQKQPTQAEIAAEEAMMEQRTSEMQKAMIDTLNAEISRRLCRETRTA